MEGISIGDLRIDVAPPKDADVALRLDWRGRSIDREPHVRLGPFFNRVMKQAEHRASPIELHFEEISGFNSSTIGFLVQLIQLAQRRGVKLVIVYDARQMWQRVSFKVFELPPEVLRTSKITLAPGDQMLLYTDGIVESFTNGEMFGFDRLREGFVNAAQRGPKETVDAILREVLAFNPRCEDDLTLLAIEYTGGQSSKSSGSGDAIAPPLPSAPPS